MTPKRLSMNDVRKLASRQLQNHLAKEKNSRKYIPSICVEVSSVKDQARCFAHPVLFLQKSIDDLQMLNFDSVNRFLEQLSLPPIQLDDKFTQGTAKKLTELPEQLKVKQIQLTRVLDQLRPLSVMHHQNPASPIEITASMQYRYRDMKFSIGMASQGLIFDVEDATENLNILSSRILLIISRAGQGKTNFVCDFAETVLTRRQIPCVFFTGREFNHVVPEKIGEYITREIFGDHMTNLDEALCYLNQLASKSNHPFIIIIDGINEHRSIETFSHYLEAFIEKAICHENIRLIVTCREEYFEERFSNLVASSFADKIFLVKSLGRCMSGIHKTELVNGYFRFFNLNYPLLSEQAREKLENDTLLLRIFCEAYGDVNAARLIQLPQIIDIYRDTVFREYFRRKLASASASDGDVSSSRARNRYREVLSLIVDAMLSGCKFSDIPLADFHEEYDDTIEALVGEDVIIRKDLKSIDDILDKRVEVLNFTFDEFRDFLLANHLVNVVFPRNRLEFELILDRLINPSSLVAEGIKTYLFFAARQPNGEGVLRIIERKGWYGDLFIKSIFSAEEASITEEDIAGIRTRFYESPRYASWIVRMLVWRWRTTLYPRLNILLLFEILDTIDDADYEKLIRPGFTRFGMWGFDGSYSWEVEELTDDLRGALTPDHLPDSEEFVNLMRFLIYLFPILDKENRSYPAFDTFMIFSKIDPDTAVKLLGAHASVRNVGVRSQIWRMLTYMRSRKDIPNDIVDKACNILLELDSRDEKNDPLGKEIVWFLQEYWAQNRITYRQAVVEKMDIYSQRH